MSGVERERAAGLLCQLTDIGPLRNGKDSSTTGDWYFLHEQRIDI